MFTTETVFLTNIENKAYAGLHTLKMVSGKRPKYQ